MADRRPVLFVDDEAPMREAVSQWLELAGFLEPETGGPGTSLARLLLLANGKETDLHIVDNLWGPIPRGEEKTIARGWDTIARALKAYAERPWTPMYPLHGVASFFPHFRRQPPPRCGVAVCRDAACWLEGAGGLAAGPTTAGRRSPPSSLMRPVKRSRAV